MPIDRGHREDGAGADSREGPFAVTVVRSGGIAGLRRQWNAEPAQSERAGWIALIEDCPWDAASGVSDPVGADRYCWRVSADDGVTRREADLADAAVHGPWRVLIDAVRAWPEPSSPTLAG